MKNNNSEAETVRSDYPMRINKYLAHKGYATRKDADNLIKDHKVFINGIMAILGDKVEEKDSVDVLQNNKPKSYSYFSYNKPRGIITHSPTNGEKEIKEMFPIKDVFPVGRLDKDSHGLIILTNDGRITDRLLNPKHTHEKEYVVKVNKTINSRFKFLMEKGVLIEGYMTKMCQISIMNDNTFKIIISEGKKHQIKRMCSALGYNVVDLKRIRIMNIELGNTKEGGYREIKDKELKEFLHGLRCPTLSG